MKIVFLSNDAFTLIRFRGHLIRQMVQKGHYVLACCPAKDQKTVETILQLGAVYLPMNLSRTGTNPIKDFFYYLRLRRLFREQQPDLLFSYTIKPVIYGSLAASKEGVSRIYSLIPGLGYVFAGNSLKRQWLNNLVRGLYRAALAKNKIIFFQNPDDRDFFIQKNLVLSQQAVQVNGSGISLGDFPFEPPHLSPVTFLLMARMLWDKGVGEFIEAARRIKKDHPDVVFKLVGTSDENPASVSTRQIQSWVNEGVIEHAGFVENILPLMEKTSVFVLPSYYREGVPRAILEALSMGRPVITTDAPGCRETVLQGENGFLVPPKNVDELKKAMEKFIENPSLIEIMGRKSRQLAEEKFDVQKVNQAILEAMEI